MPFLTVKEASQLVNKSPSSIRRIIYPIIENDAHPDRDQVLPNVADVMKLRMSGESFPWRLSEELLRREIASDPSPQTSGNRPGQSPAEGELISILRRELEIKNTQISQQSEMLSKHIELVTGLSERIREGNVLIATLQQRLALTDGRGDKPESVVDVKPVETEKKPKSEKGSAAPVKESKSAKPKLGFFAKLFS